MKLILITDIFGVNPAFNELAEKLHIGNRSPTIIDPYSGIDKQFESETSAYDYFQQHTGFKTYKTVLWEQLHPFDEPLFLIGFSAGATAAWLLLHEFKIPGQAVFFYGSGIRHYTHLSPQNKILCVFPDHESHFDVSQLAEKLEQNPSVTCQITPYSHGFMNKCSLNFNQKAYNEWIEKLIKIYSSFRLTYKS